MLAAESHSRRVHCSSPNLRIDLIFSPYTVYGVRAGRLASFDLCYRCLVPGSHENFRYANHTLHTSGSYLTWCDPEVCQICENQQTPGDAREGRFVKPGPIGSVRLQTHVLEAKQAHSIPGSPSIKCEGLSYFCLSPFFNPPCL